jgi:glycosyltransferase involved in cell wall biosynthesis
MACRHASPVCARRNHDVVKTCSVDRMIVRQNAVESDRQSKCAVPVATVVIATKNRKDDLHRALTSACAQSCRIEVLVMDDGSADGSDALVRNDFPQVQLHRSESSRGYIGQRNAAARLASAPILFSIDDDAVFSTPQVVEQVLAEFTDPRIGAVAIPCIDVLKSNVPRQRIPADNCQYVSPEFIGTAYAVRRDIFLQLGGFREELFHQGEERDFCARLYNAGYVVSLRRADPIHHFESPIRDTRRMDIFGRRNDVLFPFYNVPWPDLAWHLVGTTANGVAFGLRNGKLLSSLRGLMAGYSVGIRSVPCRQPISRSVYRLLRRMRRMGYLRLDEVIAQLPATT